MSGKLKPVVLVLCAWLAGCTLGPPRTSSGAIPTVADAGLPPSDNEAMLMRFLQDRLKDPESARIRNLNKPVFMAVNATTYSPSFYGWVTCADVNAKNSYGAYAGATTYLLVSRDSGQIVFNDKERPDWEIRSSWVRDVCRRAASGGF